MHLPAPASGVAFLFTDIEGSTALLHELGEEYSSLLGAHRDVIRAAVNEHRGEELGTQGDSFAVAFSNAADAISAALAALSGLTRCTDGRGRPVRVRMGVHFGRDLLLVGGDYVGMTIHLAARVGSAANGGQLIVSQAAWETARDHLGADCHAVDLGLHRLKDIPELVQLFQLTRPDVSLDDRPVRTVPLHSSNLAAGQALVGREAVVAEVTAALRSAAVVTLTGPGGVGKSSVARHAAMVDVERGQRDVWWVPLGSERDADGIAAALAGALDLPPSTDALALARERLTSGRALLVLDGCEHLVAQLRPLIERFDPSITVLATSREPLGVAGEAVIRLAGLGVDDGARLLWERSSQGASGRVPDPTEDRHCRDIAQRLDGIPLALELAAARTNLLSLPDLLARLDDSLGVLRRRGSALQDTLRGTIAWSFDLLNDAERGAMTQLSVFPSSFDAFAAAKVCSSFDEDLLDVLEALVAKSLLVTATGMDGPRLRMLDPVRQFAAEQAEVTVGARRPAESGLIDWADQFSERAETGLEDDAAAWLRRTRTDLPNVMAAAACALSANDPMPEAALRIATRLQRFWLVSGLRDEGYRLLTASLDAIQVQPGSSERWVGSLLVASELAFELGETEAAIEHARQALLLAEGAGDEEAALRAVRELGYLHLAQGDMVAAGRCLDRLKHAATIAGARPVHSATLLAAFGEHAAARRIREQELITCRAGQSAHATAVALNFLASLDVVEGDLELAAERFNEALEIVRELADDSCTAVALHGLASVRALDGDLSAAISLQQQSLVLRLGIAEITSIVLSAEALADVLLTLGATDLALRFAQLGAALVDRHGGRAFWPHVRLEAQRVQERLRATGTADEAAAITDPLRELGVLAQSLGTVVPVA